MFSQSKKAPVGGNWVSFFSKGKEAGFSFKEIETLRNLAVQCEIETPALIFSSKSQLDRCIYIMVRRLKMSGEGNEREAQDFLSKLYDFRQKIEIDKSAHKTNILNSRQINEGQALQVLVSGVGVFKSEVVKNTSQYMTITRPVNKKITSVPSWGGARISIYFWREADAGYVYDADVLDEVFSLGISSLKVSHSDKLLRTQKRKSVRVRMHQSAFLYLAPVGEPSHLLETSPGLKCSMEDLSDTGCAVTVGGMAKSGMRVKIQFRLENKAVCMTGTIRSTNYNEKDNRSILHIEAENLPLETRNLIFAEVFGLLSLSSLDDMPFSVMDNNGAAANAGNSAPLGGEQAAAESPFAGFGSDSGMALRESDDI